MLLDLVDPCVKRTRTTMHRLQGVLLESKAERVVMTMTTSSEERVTINLVIQRDALSWR